MEVIVSIAEVDVSIQEVNVSINFLITWKSISYKASKKIKKLLKKNKKGLLLNYKTPFPAGSKRFNCAEVIVSIHECG